MKFLRSSKPRELKPEEMLDKNGKPLSKGRCYLKRLGWGGLIFFTVKGLLWLIIPVMVAKGCQ